VEVYANGLAVGGNEVLVVRVGNGVELGTGEFVLRKMHVHLVTVKVGIVRVAASWRGLVPVAATVAYLA